MKTILKIAAIASTMLLSSVAANAQMYAGGSLGYSSEVDKDDDGNKDDSKSRFSFSPKVGYSLDEKLSIGLGFSVGNTASKTYDANGDELTNPKTSTWSIAPFTRYTVAEFGKLSIVGEGTIYFAGSTTDYDSTGLPKVKSSEFGINIAPILVYEASEKISLEASINLLSLGYSSYKANTDYDATTSRFDFGADSNGLINTGNISIGFMYKF